MQFIIVANDDLAALARRLAHALSMQKTHSGAFWTVKHYRDNEAQLDGKQPVVFLGDNEVAKSYVDILPERFRGFGTRCSYEGAKAALIADEPDDVTDEDIASLKRGVEGNQEELRRRAASSGAGSAAGLVGLVALGWLTGSIFMAAMLYGLGTLAYGLVALPFGISKEIRARRRKQEYRKLQYEYALSRFLKDEFEKFVGGLEGR